MKNVALMCDSSADITKEQEKDLGIHVVRMPITIDGKEFIEEETIFDEDVIRALNEGKQVKTAQPIIGDLTRMWEELLETYDEVFYIPLSKHLSGTCGVALRLAEEYNGRVTVLDSEFVCYPVVLLLGMVKDMISRGYSCAEIKHKIETETDLYAVLIPENLTTLKNGGRISPAAAAVAGLLKIQPLLKVEHGQIDLADKVRTLKKAYREGIAVVTKDIDPSEYVWMIIDADNREMSDELKDQLEEVIQQPVLQCSFKAVIMSHAGPGTIGFGRLKKLNY